MDRMIRLVFGEMPGIGYMLWAIGTGIAAVAYLYYVVSDAIACPTILNDLQCSQYQGQHTPFGQVALVAAAWLLMGVVVPYLIRRRHR